MGLRCRELGICRSAQKVFTPGSGGMRSFITSIFIDCLRKNIVPSSRQFLGSLGNEHTGSISSITVAEISAGAHLAQRKNALEKTLQLLEITGQIRNRSI